MSEIRSSNMRRRVRQGGFTLVELMVVVSVIGLLAAIALPGYAKARESSWRNACVATLRQMESAKAQAAFDNHWSNNDSASTIGNPLYMNTISQYLRAGVRPRCPSGSDCYYNAIGENPVCNSNLPGHSL